MTPAEELLIKSLPQALSETDIVCSSVNVGSTKTGIDMNAVELLGHIIKDIAERTADNDSYGCVKFVAFCNVPDDNPFMAGVSTALLKRRRDQRGRFRSGCRLPRIGCGQRQGFRVPVRNHQAYGVQDHSCRSVGGSGASRRLGIPFGIIDLSLAPTPAVGDSVGEVLEKIGLEQVGAPGTTAALAMLNDQVKKGGIMAPATWVACLVRSSRSPKTRT